MRLNERVVQALRAAAFVSSIGCAVATSRSLRGAHGRTWEAAPGQVLGSNDPVVAAAAAGSAGASGGAAGDGGGEGATALGVFCSTFVASCSPALGVLPLAFVSESMQSWLGPGNAVACGMMVAAAVILLLEGIEVSLFRALLGTVLGVAFVMRSRTWLRQHGDVEDGLVEMMGGGGGGGGGGGFGEGLLPEHSGGGGGGGGGGSGGGGGGGSAAGSGAAAADSDGGAAKGHGAAGAAKGKMLLLLAVMTLHCAAEGIGLGSSFGSGKDLGAFVTFAIAVHNVPEGLAIGLVVAPQLGVPRAALLAVLAHLPQPLMALPAFLSVDTFSGVLPVGLGFAAGAMATTARTEILADALAAAPKELVWKIVGGSATFMFLLQTVVRE
jgi:zinc transporter ZupT